MSRRGETGKTEKRAAEAVHQNRAIAIEEDVTQGDVVTGITTTILTTLNLKRNASKEAVSH